MKDADAGSRPAPPSVIPGLSRYGQLAQTLRTRILQGEWAPGDNLPAEAALARSYGVALGTMRQALAVLVDEGLLVREQGRGTFVRLGLEGASLLRFFRFRQAKDDALAVPQSRILSHTVRRATPGESELFDLAAAGRVLQLQRVRSLAQQPCLLEQVNLPLPLFTPLAESDPSGWGPLLYPLYQRLCGVVVARARDHLAIARLNEAQAAWLGLPAHAPGLRVQREAFSLTGQCIEARTTWGDAFAFEYTAELR